MSRIKCDPLDMANGTYRTGITQFSVIFMVIWLVKAACMMNYVIRCTSVASDVNHANKFRQSILESFAFQIKWKVG